MDRRRRDSPIMWDSDRVAVIITSAKLEVGSAYQIWGLSV